MGAGFYGLSIAHFDFVNHQNKLYTERGIHDYYRSHESVNVGAFLKRLPHEHPSIGNLNDFYSFYRFLLADQDGT